MFFFVRKLISLLGRGRVSVHDEGLNFFSTGKLIAVPKVKVTV